MSIDDYWYGVLFGLAVGYLLGWWRYHRAEVSRVFWKENYSRLWSMHFEEPPLTPKNGRGRTAEK